MPRRWRWAGKVGSGLDDALLVALKAELDARPAWQPSFARPEGTADVRWVEPELVVQVRYGAWPEGSPLRFPVFVRLRRDKTAIECTMPRRSTAEREEPAIAAPLEIDQPVRELRLSNLQKVFWKAEGITKGALIDHYRGRGLLREVSALDPVETIYANIVKRLPGERHP